MVKTKNTCNGTGNDGTYLKYFVLCIWLWNLVNSVCVQMCVYGISCKLLWIAVNSYFCYFPILKSAMMSFFCSSVILAATMCFLDYCIWISRSTLWMSVMNIRHAICLTIQKAPNWNAEKAALANQLRDVVHSWRIIKRILELKSLLPPCNESSHNTIRAQWRDEKVRRQEAAVWDKHYKSRKIKIWLPLFKKG